VRARRSDAISPREAWAATPLLRRPGYEYLVDILLGGGFIRRRHRYQDLVDTALADARDADAEGQLLADGIGATVEPVPPSAQRLDDEGELVSRAGASSSSLRFSRMWIPFTNQKIW